MKLMLVPETEAEQEALQQGAVPTPLIELALGMTSARAMMAAEELGIVAALAEQPATTDGLAERLGLDPDGAGVLLEVLLAFGMVAFGPRGWTPTARAGWLLDPGLSRLVAFNRDQWDLTTDLTARLRGAGPDLHHSPVARKEGFWTRYLQALAITAGETCSELAAALPIDGPTRILDVGGGHGWYAAALCERFEALAAGEAACRHPRVSFVAGDLRDGAWGEGYDVVLLVNVTPHLDREALFGAMKSGREAVSDNGIMAVIQPRRLVNRGVDAQLHSAGELLYWLAAGRRPWPEATLRTALEEAGFSAIERATLETGPGSLLLVARA